MVTADDANDFGRNFAIVSKISPFSVSMELDRK